MGATYRNKAEYTVSSWTLEKLELRAALEAIARHGFTSVEVWADNAHLDPRLGQDPAAAARWLRELGLSAHSVHAPFRGFPAFEDEGEFRKARQELWRRAIDGCSELGAPIMVVHGLDRGEYNCQRGQLQVMGDSLANLCDHGKKKGVLIALENIVGRGGEEEVPCRLQDHVARFPGIGLKYCLDLGHALLDGADIIAEVDAAGGDLVTMHVHNNHGSADSHNIPDEGIMDWPAVHAWLRDGRYDGQFVLEVDGCGRPLETLARVAALF